jgi:hypothetical protein
MTGDRIALALSCLLGIILVIRLLSLRLHRIYSVFCIFVFVQVLGSAAYTYEVLYTSLDYRITFLLVAIVAWVVVLWLVYGFLGAVLATLPGILRFSRKVLNCTCAVAAALTLFGAHAALALFSSDPSRDTAAKAVMIMDPYVNATALVVLLAILAFVLWFPVEMPKNLVRFSFGLIAYFTAQICLVLVPQFIPGVSAAYLSVATTLANGICFLYWSLALTAEGETSSVRIGHGWRPREQQRLLQQLEGMNAALLQGARRREIYPKTGTTP